MSGFFTIFDYFFDMIRPTSREGCYHSCFSCLCGWFHCLGNIVRPDTMTIVAVNGSSYYDSSRFGEYLTGKVPLIEYYQFSSRLFSLGAHALIVSLSIAFAIYFPKLTSIWSIVVVIIGSLTISTCFVSFYIDIAHGVYILYLLDQEYLTQDKGDYRLSTETQGVSAYKSGLAI